MKEQSNVDLTKVLDAMGTDFKQASPSKLGDESWLVNIDGQDCIVKYYPSHDDFFDIQWGHDFLGRLSETGFAAPRPIPAFPGGSSLIVLDGLLWGAVSFIPGRRLHWEPEPDLVWVGKIIAEYHMAAASIRMESNRPSSLPLAHLAESPSDDRIERALGGREGAIRFRAEIDKLKLDLLEIAHTEGQSMVIHGDCTTDNVVIDGLPPRITGLIDFDKSYIEVDLADVGFGLYRSGRPDPAIVQLDPVRVSRVVAGYAAARGMDRASIARAVAVYARARGLQLIVRWVGRGVQDCRGTLKRVVWISDHEHELVEAVASEDG